MLERLSDLVGFLAELRRRKVVRAALWYGGGAIVVLSGAEVVVETYLLPQAVRTWIGILVILGFPPAMIAAWLFDWTPEGLRRSPPGEGVASGVVGGTLAVVSVAALVGAFLLIPRAASMEGAEEPVVELPPGPAGPAVVGILPFQDASPDGELGWLGTALEARLEAALSSLPEVSVLSTRALTEGDRPIPLDSLAELRDTDVLIRAVLGREGDTASLVVQLLDARGRIVDSDEVRESFASPDGLVRGIARGVEEVLRPALGRELRLRDWRAGTGSARAFELRYRAEERRRSAGSLMSVDLRAAGGALGQADSLLAEARGLDPGWPAVPLARAEVAENRALVAMIRGDALGDVTALLDRGIAHADTALRLDPSSAEALALRGLLRWRKHVYRHGDLWTPSAELDGAEADLRAALDLDPSLARAAAVLSEVLFMARGDHAQAASFARRAYETDRYMEETGDILNRLALATFEAGRDEEALRWCREGIRRFPAEARHHGCALEVMAWGGLPPEPDSAWALHREVEGLTPPGMAGVEYYDYAVAAVLARAGQPDSAAAVLARAAEAPSPLAGAEPLLWEAGVRYRMGQDVVADSLLTAARRTDPAAVRRAADLRMLAVRGSEAAQGDMQNQ